MSKKLKGIYSDMSNEDYHGNRTHHSSSVLKTALNNPQEFFRVYVQGCDPSKKMNEAALAIGNYCHIALLEPHLLETETAIYPGASRRGAAWELFRTENADKTIITQTQLDLVNTMLEEFSKDMVDIGDGLVAADALFQEGFAEESLFTELDGHNIKTRFDYRIEDIDGRGLIRDLKTTSRTANTPQEATDICNMYGYFTSAALYVDAAEKEFGKPYDFHLVFVSKKDLKTNVYKVSEKSLEIGRKMYKRAIKMIKLWEKTGNYTSGLREI